jgi:DNA-binding transcriptional MerR regulator
MTKEYKTILADPPWEMGKMGVGKDKRPGRKYKVGKSIHLVQEGEYEAIASSEAAEILGISRRSLIRWEEQGWLKSKRDKRGYREFNKANVILAKKIRDELLAIRRSLRKQQRKETQIYRPFEKELLKTLLTGEINKSIEQDIINLQDWSREMSAICEEYDEFIDEQIASLLER